jgi:hypothetical protein
MNRRRGTGSQDAGDTGVLQKFATFHVLISSFVVQPKRRCRVGLSPDTTPQLLPLFLALVH